MAAFFHRKILQKTMTPSLVFIKEEDCIYDGCNEGVVKLPPISLLMPPPPPLSSLPSDHPLSLFRIILFCGLAVSLSFICYFTITAIYRRRLRNHENIDEISEDFVNEDHGPVVHHPIWLINTIGLEQSQIDSIQVVKYRKDDGLIEGTDCSVCLSEFEDDESLRLLPKCSHAFHVPCIDTWLRSHKNCPLCRAPIVKNTTDNETDHHATIEMNSSESSTRDETEGEDSEIVDHHVVEVENNGEMAKSSSEVRVQSDLADRHRVQEEEFVATRRSVSMDEFSASIVHLAVARHSSRQLAVSKKLMVNSIPKGGPKLKGSSSGISIRSRLMKSSSIGHSSRKASSFVKRSFSSSGKGSQNRSY